MPFGKSKKDKSKDKAQEALASQTQPGYPTNPSYPTHGAAAAQVPEQQQLYGQPGPQGPPPPYAPPGYAPPAGQGPPPGYPGPPPQGYGQPPQGYAPPPQGYAQPPQGYAHPPQQHYQPRPHVTVQVQGGFDAGARFDGAAQPNIPPPPPGCMPNSAQMAMSQGHNVVVTQRPDNFFTGGSDGGYVWF